MSQSILHCRSFNKYVDGVYNHFNQSLDMLQTPQKKNHQMHRICVASSALLPRSFPPTGWLFLALGAHSHQKLHVYCAFFHAHLHEYGVCFYAHLHVIVIRSIISYQDGTVDTRENIKMCHVLTNIGRICMSNNMDFIGTSTQSLNKKNYFI